MMLYSSVYGFSENLRCFSIFVHILRGSLPQVCEILFIFL
jgi:hypothetical protein